MAFLNPVKVAKLLILVVVMYTFFCSVKYMKEENFSRMKREGSWMPSFGTLYSADGDLIVNAKRGNISCARPPCTAPFPYKMGKSIQYAPIDNCANPEYIKSYKNPCWKPLYKREKLACAPRIFILGFHKSGTTDLAKWFNNHKEVAGLVLDLFKDKPSLDGSLLTRDCPIKWLEQHDRSQTRYVKTPNMSNFDDCPACVIVSVVLKQNAKSITRQSAIQYLQYVMADDSRYIVTMREPATRMISHFFYVFKVDREGNPYLNYTLDQVGNSFFHKIVSESVAMIKKCLVQYGTTACILEPTLNPIVYPHPYITHMILFGCYATYVKEIVTLLPKNQIFFSKLEEYSMDQGKAMKKIYQFVQVSSTGLNNPEESGKAKQVKNKGYDSKPVLPKTIALLERFYEPFNTQLAQLLEDDKWLWK